MTTDPVPTPAAQAIAEDEDPYWMGWLLVTINASDIAASGAQPEAFLAALDLPRDWPVALLERLMLGIKESCAANGLSYVGGNIREAKSVAAVGTAFGFCRKPPLTRIGAKAGTKIVVLGRPGLFWSDVIDLRAGDNINKKNSPLFRPISQTEIMSKLHDQDLIACAMDTSDGLAPSLEELAKKNGIGISVDLERVRSCSGGLTTRERVERLWMGWGDWTVLAGVHSDNTYEVEQVVEENGFTANIIGEFTGTFQGVTLRDGGKSVKLGRLESERFAEDSWFHLGIGAYEDMLRNLSLP